MARIVARNTRAFRLALSEVARCRVCKAVLNENWREFGECRACHSAEFDL